MKFLYVSLSRNLDDLVVFDFLLGLTLYMFLFIFVSSYVLMAEPDHIIVKPIPNLSRDGLGAAFPFFYIEPKKYEKVLRKYFPEHKGPVTKIDPIGNSPVIVGRVCNFYAVLELIHFP